MEKHEIRTRREAQEALATLTTAGVDCKPHPHWATYITLATGNMVDVFEAEENLKDARVAVADGDSETLTEAIDELTSASGPEIEVCCNNEWLRVFGGYEPPEDTGNDEYDEDAFRAHCEAMEQLFPEADFSGPRSGRVLCHQWNGANFVYHNSGLGTFDILTVEGERLWNSI